METEIEIRAALKGIAAVIERANGLHATMMDEGVDEASQDAANVGYWAALNEIAAALVSVSRGAIDTETALRMAHHQRGKVAALMARMA